MAYLNKISGIYTITSISTGKYYIGRSFHCIERFSKHKSTLRKNIHINSHLQRAWNKYGESDFKFEILEEYPKEFLSSMENWWCNMLNAHDRKFGYNVDPTSPFGKVSSSQETIDKIRKSNTGRVVNDTTKKKLSDINIGKIPSQETILKLRNNKRNKSVDMYSKDGEFIRTFVSLKDAERETGIYCTEIKNCIIDKVKITHKKIFKNHGEILSKEEIEYRNKNSFESNKKPVVGYYLNGEKIGEFDSFWKASKFTNLDQTKIALCCRGKQKRVKDTIWKFLSV